MTIDEYAALEQHLGSRLLNVDGVWWRQVRPLFWRPLFPFEPLPEEVQLPLMGWLGGCQYPVTPESAHDSHLNFMVFHYPQGYDPANLKREDRKNLRRAHQYLTLRRITDLDRFAAQGLELLRQFFARSSYRYRRDRLRPKVFRRWAGALLAEPRVLVLGAYSEEELCEVHISFRVHDVLIFDVAFASAQGRALRSSDGVLDHLRREAANTDAGLICLGPAGVKESLDGFKLRRGASVLSLPARLRLNPLAEALLRLASPALLRRLRGMDG